MGKKKTDVCVQCAPCLFICSGLGQENWPTLRGLWVTESFSSAGWGLRHSSSWATRVMYFFVCVSVCSFLCIAKGRVKASAEVTHTEFWFSWINQLPINCSFPLLVYMCLWLSVKAEHIFPEQKFTCDGWMHGLVIVHTECLEVLIFSSCDTVQILELRKILVIYPFLLCSSNFHNTFD